jgi:tRNA dimethylallyltransferase
MALTDGLAEVPATPPEIRDTARALLDDIGVEALHAKLTDRDPLTASRLRASDPQRVLRAFEVFEATGRPLAEWQSAPAEPVLKHKRIAAFVLDPPRAELRAQIARRFKAEALDAAITATRQFAKRQMTWFRHRMPHYIWFDPLVSNLITQYGQISA